ncbi:Hypothetical protein FKW44_019743 [Caligus rogercresseyi]|uniref:Uncharacterized protein n=1 Tax=Caligus rogercresseyi TaxID=217165 RepID=A0A7T8GX13_CALRO|nr:Hypothetical protein FKW44_019743 [Caligus rogercresseyi]
MRAGHHPKASESRAVFRTSTSSLMLKLCVPGGSWREGPFGRYSFESLYVLSLVVLEVLDT